MHAAPARYVSVSELYSADEVELLLEEIRELEPTSCRGEDVQDFEIAGSGLGGCGGGVAAGGGGGGGGGGGRSPCGTELTERSWDSHAHYSRAPPPRPLHVAPLYCRLSHLLTFTGAIALIIFVVCGCACACVWSLVGVRAWRLPLAARVRWLVLAALCSALAHGALLFAHVSRLAALLPVPWRRVAWLAAAWSAGALPPAGLATLHAVLLAPEYRYAPPHVAALLLAAASLCLCGACAAWVLVCVDAVACYRRHGAEAGAKGAPRSASGGSLRAAYRAVPTAPPSAPAPAPPSVAAAPQPSTSRHEPL